MKNEQYADAAETVITRAAQDLPTTLDHPPAKCTRCLKRWSRLGRTNIFWHHCHLEDDV